MPQPIALAPISDSSVHKSVRKFAADVTSIIDKPLAHATYSAGDEAANIRRITVQVRNRRNEALHRRYIVHIWIATSTTGAPQNAQVVGFVSGTLLETVLVNGEWRFETDANGQVIMDITIAGAATRYIRGFVLALADTSSKIDWT